MQKVELIQKIKCCDIMNDPNNPRKDISGAEDLELQRSIKEFGIIQPIMVRPVEDRNFKYMIVYGHRRFEAYEALKAISISCIVKDLSDEEALEFQIIENLQRKGINPMEESNAFQRLIKFRLSTAEVIADKLGVSTKYVYDRLALQRILPEVQEAVMNGKISISHGKQFARLPAADQAKLLKNINLNDSLQVSSIRSAITSMFKLNVDTAIFDIGNATLVTSAGSCMKCKKRTGCNMLLFEEVEMEDICLDSVCYESKVQAHIDEQIKKNQDAGKVVKLLSATWGVAKDGLLNKDNWRDEGEKETQTVGIFLEISSYCGYKIGQIINLRNEDIVAENKEEANMEVDKSKSSKHINYKEVFAGKCQDAILDAFNNSLIEFPQEAPNEIISLYCTDKFSNLLHSLERKITTILGIDMDSDGEYSAFKNHVATLSLGEKLALIHLINSLDAAESFSNYHGIKEEAIADLQKKLQSTNIDFFAIAADLNSPYPLFTPTEVAETT